MIEILPHYKHKKGDDILALYLKMVAAVVPFYPKDILGENVSFVRRARMRKKEYRALLKEYLTKDYPEFEQFHKSKQDALLAQKLIYDYSKELYDFLYDGVDSKTGNVNHDNLIELLTFKMPGGILPEKMDDFRADAESRETDASKRAEKKKKLLKWVFPYDKFASHEDIYQLLQLLDVEVCPYCNRQCITTVSTKKRHTRPQLDHFKNKSDYPFLALSINNLVPCCGVCNLLKQDKDKKILYPYSEGMNSMYTFKAKDKNGQYTELCTGVDIGPDNFEIDLEKGAGDANALNRAENTIDMFALRELYQSHKPYVASLYKMRYIYTEKLCEDFLTQCPEAFSKILSMKPIDGILRNLEEKEQIKAAAAYLKTMLLLINYQPENWTKTPLAKLTYDISREIDALNTK